MSSDTILVDHLLKHRDDTVQRAKQWQDAFNRAQDDTAALRTELDKQRSRADGLAADLAVVVSARDRVEAEKSSLQTDVKQWQDAFNRAQDDIAALRAECDTWRAAAEASRKATDMLKLANAKLAHARDGLRADLRELARLAYNYQFPALLSRIDVLVQDNVIMKPERLPSKPRPGVVVSVRYLTDHAVRVLHDAPAIYVVDRHGKLHAR